MKGTPGTARFPGRKAEVLEKRQRKQKSNCQHLLAHGKSKRVPENIHFCFIDYAKAFDFVDHNKLWKILKQLGIADLPLEKSGCRSGSNS